MEGDLNPLTLITTAFGILSGILATYFGFRTKKVEAESRVAEAEVAAEGEGASKFLDGQVAFQQYVDGIVSKKVEEATAEIREDFTKLAQEFSNLKSESQMIQAAVALRETRLFMWRLEGRKEPFPMLPENIMEKLGIAHLLNIGSLTDE